MTLENTLRKKLAEPATAGRQSVAFAHDGWTVTLTVETADALSCLLWEIDLRRDGAESGDVKAWADRVAGKASGLMESLRVIEVDPTTQQALLRSDTPTPREAGVHYFDVRLTGTAAARVRRFHGFPHTGEPGVQITFALTYEVLAKLIADIAA
jgi:hypothetical protein